MRPEQVEQIEILRGAASARFGAEAMGGAIAITTRGAHRVHGNLTQGIDSRNGRFTRIAGGGENGRFGWSLMAEDKVDNGFRTVPDSPFPYQITVADERGKTQLIDGKFGWRGRSLEASLNIKRTDSWSFFGRPSWAFDWRTDNIRAQMTWQVFDKFAVEASLGEERYETTGVRDRGTGVDTVGLAPQNRLVSSYRQRELTLAASMRDRTWSVRSGINRVHLAENFANADYATHLEKMSADSTIRKEALFASAEFPVGAGRLELGLRREELADAAQLSSLADETPEGRSIVVFAKSEYGLRGRGISEGGMKFIPFTAVSRMSGVDYKGGEVRKGAAEAVKRWA